MRDGWREWLADVGIAAAWVAGAIVVAVLLGTHGLEKGVAKIIIVVGGLHGFLTWGQREGFRKGWNARCRWKPPPAFFVTDDDRIIWPSKVTTEVTTEGGETTCVFSEDG